MNETKTPLPEFVGEKFTHTSYYSSASRYQDFPSEQTYITLRGPLFTECYDCFQIVLPKVDAFTTVTRSEGPGPRQPVGFPRGSREPLGYRGAGAPCQRRFYCYWLDSL